MIFREREDGVAERSRHLAFRRDEIGCARRVQNVLVGGARALEVVAVEERIGRTTL